MNDILIKNIRLINPATAFDETTDILISDGIVKKIARDIKQADYKDKTSIHIIDGQGLNASPGLIDVHSHFRDPGFTYKEDIFSGAAAAKRGGFTTVILMANTNPKVDNSETLEYVIEKGKKTGINVLTVANITKAMAGKELSDMALLVKSGAAGFSDDGLPVLDEGILRKAFTEAAKLNVPVSLHEENLKFIKNNGINAGEVAHHLGIEGADRQAEISMIKRDVQIAAQTGVTLNIQHVSARESVEIIRNARKTNKNIHAEATPHHFTLTEESVKKYGTNAKMNPPLRKEADRLAIIEGLKDNTIDIIATDHAPHSSEEKAKAFVSAPSGIIGLETALSLGLTELVDKGYLSINELIEKMTVNPARLYSIDNKYGSVEEGKRADLVIFNPDEKWTVNEFASKSCNCPFLGMTLKGKVKYTIAGGSIVYCD